MGTLGVLIFAQYYFSRSKNVRKIVPHELKESHQKWAENSKIVQKNCRKMAEFNKNEEGAQK